MVVCFTIHGCRHCLNASPHKLGNYIIRTAFSVRVRLLFYVCSTSKKNLMCRLLSKTDRLQEIIPPFSQGIISLNFLPTTSMRCLASTRLSQQYAFTTVVRSSCGKISWSNTEVPHYSILQFLHILLFLLGHFCLLRTWVTGASFRRLILLLTLLLGQYNVKQPAIIIINLHVLDSRGAKADKPYFCWTETTKQAMVSWPSRATTIGRRIIGHGN